MSYTTISINYNESTLCEEINFSEPGEQTYVPGDEIILSDSRLSRIRTIIVMSVNYTEDGEGGLSTTVSGFSTEYKYTRKAPNCDISFFTMRLDEKSEYEKEKPDSEVFIMQGDHYGAGGWTMRSIVQKIAGWLDLMIINGLPDYDISDFSISVGSTFFEALNRLISEFEPIVTLVGGVLYILERSGAGALSGGGFTPAGFTNRSVDGEYIPKPGCIKVEGGEGQYLILKDPAVCLDEPDYESISCPDKIYSGSVETPDGSIEEYSITENYGYTSVGDVILHSRTQTSRLCNAEGHESYAETTMEYEYDSDDYILVETTETCKIEASDSEMIVFNKISNTYEHDNHWMLINQVTSRYELFVFDGTDYVRYNPQDYNLDNLEDGESLELVDAEIRTTKYSEIDKETYGVETIIASKVWNEGNEDDAEWKTSYTFEHDIVEAGSLQRNTRCTGRTLQVYAGDCPVYEQERYETGTTDLIIMAEPAKIFSIPTPDWKSIENCYVYLAALVSTEYQKASASLPIIDPLPFMRVNGLGDIIERDILGGYYVKGYTINIDANGGYTTNLTLEARKSE